jgi:hypothetical protein
MSLDNLLAARKRAEQAVIDMPEGPLKIKAFEVILSSLLSPQASAPENELVAPREPKIAAEAPSSFPGRIGLLAAEGFFAQPRSLAEVQTALAERGWHYPQENLSTPLVRLVRQRQLRRLQLAEGNKRVWKYSRP